MFWLRVYIDYDFYIYCNIAEIRNQVISFLFVIEVTINIFCSNSSVLKLSNILNYR